MKKYIALILSLICMVSLVGCGNTPGCTSERTELPSNETKDTISTVEAGVESDTIQFKEISGLVLVKGCTEDELREKLVGESYDAVLRTWGNPTKTDPSSGTWILDEESGMMLTLAYNADGNVEDVRLSYDEKAESTETWDRIPMVMVNGTLYLDTGRESTVTARCGVMDGEITSTVDSSETPTEDGQSNFGTGYGFQYGPAEGTIEVLIDDTWWVFATERVRQETWAPSEEALVQPDTVADFETVVTISAEDAEEIANLLCTGTVSDGVPACICVRWEDGTSDCIPDCAIRLDGVLYYYHSDCGTVTDEANEQSLHLNEDCKTALNTILGEYLRLGTESVSPAQS